jgi:hypothetical protein
VSTSDEHELIKALGFPVRSLQPCLAQGVKHAFQDRGLLEREPVLQHCQRKMRTDPQNFCYLGFGLYFRA